MLLIDPDLYLLRCSDCKALIDIPLRDRAAHCRLAYRDRMVRQHKCQPATQQVAEPTSQRKATWESLWTPEALQELAVIERSFDRAEVAPIFSVPAEPVAIGH